MGDDFILEIRPTNSTFLENSTHINFSKCETILRDEYNISLTRIITFLQLEIQNKNDKSLINQVEYQAYDDNKKLIDLSICNDSNIIIFYALKNNSLDKDYISRFKDLGVDIFNINDSFFNDICHPYSNSKNDIILEDRIIDIYQNYSLCEDKCTYKEINTEHMTISCDCKIKANMSLNESSFNLEKLDELNTESNFGLIKCYKLVFSFKGKNNNIGFWIFLILVLAHIPILFFYFYKGIKSIKNYIINEMIKNGYIKGEFCSIKIVKLNSPPKIKRDNNNNKKKDQQTEVINNNKNKLIDNSSMNKYSSSARKIINLNNKDNFFSKSDKNIEYIKINKENKNNKKTKRKKVKTKRKNNMNEKKDQNLKINNIIVLNDSKNEKIKKNLEIIPTQNEKNVDDENKEKSENNTHNYTLINIDLNNIKEYTPKNSLHILNNYTFEEAINYDMRSILAIAYIFLLSKQAIFHTFLYRSPLEPFTLRLCLLIFIISSDLGLNAIFYLDDKISKKYKYAQNLFLFAFNSNLTIIFTSTFIGFIFMTLFTNLSNSIHNIRDIFRKEEEKIMNNNEYIVTDERKKEILVEIGKILKKHKIKVIILISIELSLILFFWYYVTAFCHVYSSTQTSWLLDRK